MPEALTESFCERCGTRYEFEAPAELTPLRKTRGLISGLRNYIMSQDALSDAIGDAMRSEEQQIAATQLEAFHAAFNFCIDCRQYACTNCWNDAAGRCRSCAPIPGKDDLADRLEAAYLGDHGAMHAAEAELGAAELSRRLATDAWPQTDLPEEAAGTGRPEVSWPAAEITAQAQPSEPVRDHEVDETAVPLAASTPVAPEAVEEPLPPTRVLAWEDDADLVLRPPIEEALPEPEAEWVEPVLAEAEVEAEPEPMVAKAQAEPEPEPEPEPMLAEAEAEPEPMVAEAEAEPEPMVAEAEPEPVAEPAPPSPASPPPIRPISETILRMPPRVVEPPAEVDDEALAARKAKLDLLGLGDPGVGQVTSERQVLPYRSSGAAVHPSEIMRRTVGGPSALWDASAREVSAARSMVAVQSCGSCGLSLSASARFCRRCGTRQARSA